MSKAALLVSFLVINAGALSGQIEFPELVVTALGSDQDLINGVLFSNQYGRIEGQPYSLDARFRPGKVCINDRWHEQVKLRYNICSQKVEIEYRTL